MADWFDSHPSRSVNVTYHIPVGELGPGFATWLVMELRGETHGWSPEQVWPGGVGRLIIMHGPAQRGFSLC